MSNTTTTTTITPPQTSSKCLSCGSELNTNEHSRISELEAEVKLLNDKVCAAENKLITYDTELRRLRPPPPGLSPRTATFPAMPERSPSPANRISAFLFPSRSGGPPSPPPDCSPSELAKERSLRMQAEERLQQVTSELEDLSASLFQSANEMVAEERRARSKLEERVVVLEKRDLEKRERLGVLERAVDRISRVREMLTGAVGMDKEG
ncbi:hypothetical protein K440DRAFT_613862 [Wilcoxina mikolae CBS 423.85]|nr:hypothetical protein K440DRAFT_613862 [Wilcoxina mikolae CBS 423.85]